jgi:hypothetical protein
MILGKMMDVVVVIGGPGICMPWQHCFSPSNTVAGACFGLQGHNLRTYEASFPFVYSCLDQDFSGILKNEAHVLTSYI